MSQQTQPFTTCSQVARLFTLLPGPSRRRLPRWYSYQLSYRNPDQGGPGCVLLWEVRGGRESYQVALERDRKGNLQAHCTCADAVYRGEVAPGHQCKHVRGLLALERPEAGLPGPLGFEAVVSGWM